MLDKNGYLIDYFEPEKEDKTKMAYYKINRIDYPPEMKKKITILQHFWIKLCGEEHVRTKIKDKSLRTEPLKRLTMIYVKKWTRNKHAILM